MKRFATATLLALGLLSQAASASSPEVPSARLHELELGSDVQNLTSKINGQQYELYISLPRGYQEHPNQHYPVLYLTDGQYDYAALKSTYFNLYYDGMVPEIIIVGISWGGESPDYATLRMHDFTPEPVSDIPGSGGGAAFLQALEQEIVPLVEQKFRADPQDRALVGSSAGGLFGYYAMLHSPGFFQRFILSSPMFYDDQPVFAPEQTYAKQHKDLAARLYMAAGEFDRPDYVSRLKQLEETLRGRHYPHLALEDDLVTGLGHAGNRAITYTRGLVSIYHQEIQLDAAALADYAGTYRFGNGETGHLSVKDNTLYVDPMHGLPSLPLLASRQDEFYFNGFYFKLHFRRDSNGKIDGYELETYDQHFPAQKI